MHKQLFQIIFVSLIFANMKILVCISKTPDTTSKISFKENNTKYDAAGVQWIINPYDEWYALVRAIELKEKKPDVQFILFLLVALIAIR